MKAHTGEGIRVEEGTNGHCTALSRSSAIPEKYISHSNPKAATFDQHQYSSQPVYNWTCSQCHGLNSTRSTSCGSHSKLPQNPELVPPDTVLGPINTAVVAQTASTRGIPPTPATPSPASGQGRSAYRQRHETRRFDAIAADALLLDDVADQ